MASDAVCENPRFFERDSRHNILSSFAGRLIQLSSPKWQNPKNILSARYVVTDEEAHYNAYHGYPDIQAQIAAEAAITTEIDYSRNGLTSNPSTEGGCPLPMLRPGMTAKERYALFQATHYIVTRDDAYGRSETDNSFDTLTSTSQHSRQSRTRAVETVTLTSEHL